MINPEMIRDGIYARMSLSPRILSEEEKNQPSITHDVFQRARVDIMMV